MTDHTPRMSWFTFDTLTQDFQLHETKESALDCALDTVTCQPMPLERVYWGEVKGMTISEGLVQVFEANR